LQHIPQSIQRLLKEKKFPWGNKWDVRDVPIGPLCYAGYLFSVICGLVLALPRPLAPDAISVRENRQNEPCFGNWICYD